jgi:hypothetical protein
MILYYSNIQNIQIRNINYFILLITHIFYKIYQYYYNLIVNYIFKFKIMSWKMFLSPTTPPLQNP